MVAVVEQSTDFEGEIEMNCYDWTMSLPGNFAFRDFSCSCVADDCEHQLLISLCLGV